MGGNEFRPSCEPMDRAILARLATKPKGVKVVIVPAAAAHENPEMAAGNGVRYFNDLGARAEAAMIVDRQTAQDPAFAAQVRAADLVYFTGGDPSYLLETMRGSSAWEAALEVIEAGGILAGSSAGAMICGGQMWTSGHGWREGLSLVPEIAIIPHHASLGARWGTDRMRRSLRAGVTLVGIDEATALVGPPWQVAGSGQVLVYGRNGPRIYAQGQSIPPETV
jgi:cyanophycinase